MMKLDEVETHMKRSIWGISLPSTASLAASSTATPLLHHPVFPASPTIGAKTSMMFQRTIASAPLPLQIASHSWLMHVFDGVCSGLHVVMYVVLCSFPLLVPTPQEGVTCRWASFIVEHGYVYWYLIYYVFCFCTERVWLCIMIM